jgi:glycosyltransferase involved in cell wall biosynthesis
MGLRLRILVQLFYPELISTGQTMTELGEALQAEGVSVSVYCGYPTLLDRQRVPKRLLHAGIVVQRLWGTRFPKLNFWGKLINHLTFSMSVIWHLLIDREKSPILVTTNPPILPVLCAAICVVRRRPYLYLVFDVYPESAIKAGLLSSSGFVTRVWKHLQTFALSHAERVIVIGRCMETLIAPYMRDRSRLVHIPVWADDQGICRESAISPFPWSHIGKIVVGYSGNMARFHDIETMLAAADSLKNDTRFVFVFVGDGYKRGLVLEAASRLPNVVLAGYVAREKLGDLLASFSIGVVSLLPGHEGLSVPSKTYGLLAAGCPVLGVLPAASEIALMLQESGAGVVIAPGDTEAFVAALRDYAENPERWAAMGRKGRLVSETRYSLHHVAMAYKELLESLPLE